VLSNDPLPVPGWLIFLKIKKNGVNQSAAFSVTPPSGKPRFKRA